MRRCGVLSVCRQREQASQATGELHPGELPVRRGFERWADPRPIGRRVRVRPAWRDRCPRASVRVHRLADPTRRSSAPAFSWLKVEESSGSQASRRREHDQRTDGRRSLPSHGMWHRPVEVASWSARRLVVRALAPFLALARGDDADDASLSSETEEAERAAGTTINTPRERDHEEQREKAGRRGQGLEGLLG